MAYVDAEIASQPDCWREAAELAGVVHADLPRPGERVAVVGCGTSWFMAMAYAARREQAAPGRLVWAFGELPDGLPEDVAATGAAFVHSRTHGWRTVLGSWSSGRTPVDPMADLILAQRFAVALATSRGLDPDAPRHLSRSVVLT
ncbi:hypothetical protein [Micromonospora sp. NBC_01638]|uniref:hypothetical protein n=1 Tax=Micromonospora sp. NBC_01638 TaxID=2975982 RepID=UPI00386C54F0|nr:hypothetical protein OG811_08435 [Micromonospora sp. NBC_01638]